MDRFKAKAVAATELADLNTLAVVFAANADGSGKRLELQRALSFDESDHELGQDTYCLRTEWGGTHYGGVSSWTLEDDELTISLEEKAARDLRVQGFIVELSLTKAKRAAILRALHRVLKG